MADLIGVIFKLDGAKNRLIQKVVKEKDLRSF